MAFEASKSTLYTQIMDAAARFFGKETEAEIHDALETQPGTLEELLTKTRDEAVAANTKELSDLKEKMTGFETSLNDLKDQIETKDTRITELLDQIGTHESAIEKVKLDQKKVNDQKDQEIKTLAGQVSRLKGGKVLEQAEGDEGHEAGKTKKEEGIIAISSDALKNMATKQRSN